MNQSKPLLLRLLALFLVVMLTISVVPANVFAAAPPDNDATTETLPDAEPPGTTAETPPVPEETIPATEPDPLPVPLETAVRYYDDCFAVLSARQENLTFRIVAANAAFHNPQISACSFEVDPDIASIGFELRLDGVSFPQGPAVSHGGDLTVTVSDVFAHAEAEAIQVFDISGEYWLPLAHDGVQMDGNQATLSFYAPDLNSRFAIVEGFSEAAVYDVNYGTTLGDHVPMAVNNKISWCVYGPNPNGYGNPSNGTFSMHLVPRPASDPEGRTVGFADYVSAGCLEYWKSEPIISEGQIVNVNRGGTVEGWSSLSRKTRRKIVGYLLYGVRTLSDWSFDNTGAPTIHSTNPVINMSCAQQILIWAAIDGINPISAASYYGDTVSYYARMIVDNANRNPENYDYDKTLVLAGEGNSRQDVALILKPEYKVPGGDIIAVKTAVNSTELAGWAMELYASSAQAEQGTDPIQTAYTDSSGQARFKSVPNGTYYLREAPASRQKNDLTDWILSDKVFPVTVENQEVTVTGIENRYAPNFPYGIRKVSQCSQTVQQQLAGNRMYSLQGAEYSVSLNGQFQETLVTDSTGLASGSKVYPPGTRLTVQEVQAPPGYRLDPTVYTLVITAGENLLEVADEPLFDPPFSLTKVDQDTTAPQGDGSFSGAVFKWEYFDNDSWTGQPLRTWYLQTDDRGVADLRAENLAPGYQSDPLYVDDAGNPDIPLGTVTMTEIQNSLGYTVLPQPLKCRILADSKAPAGVTHVFDEASLQWIRDITTGNVEVLEPLDSSLLGEFRLDKIDADTGSDPQGSTNLAAKFQVINRSAHAVRIGTGKIAQPGEICCEFLTDEAGHFSSGKVFPLGTYEITEAEPPLGYELNPDWKQTFTVTADQQSFDFTASSGSACQNAVIRGGFRIVKQDLALGSRTDGETPLDGITFTVTNESLHPVTVDGTVYAPGEAVMTLAIAWNGAAWSAETGPVLPYGTYGVTENEVTPGMANDHYLVDPEKKSVEVRDSSSVPEILYEDQRTDCKIIVHKADPLGKPLAGARFQLLWSEDGIAWNPVTFSETVTKGGCSSPDLENGSLVSGEDGVIAFTGLHFQLLYRLVELEAPDGYVLLTGPAFEGALPDFTYVLTVHNSPGFTFPTTGSDGLHLVLLAGFTLASAALLGCFFLAACKKRARKKASHF